MSHFQDLKLSNRLRFLQWAMPIAITIIAALYQLGPAKYVHDSFGDWTHYALEVLFYGTVGPAVTWFTLRLVRRWVEQKEQAESEVYRLNVELQQRVDERTRELRQKNEALAAANRQLQQLDRLKSEFVSLVSHELRAPLTNLGGALELMESECALFNPTCARMMVILRGQASRLGRMIDEVLSVSRIEAGRLTLTLEPVDAVSIVNRVIDEFATHHTRRKFSRPVSSDHPQVCADADRLYQVITNLVDNAVKYSPEDSDVIVSVASRGSEGIISVSDRGPGIPPEEQERIFEKFHRLDSGDSRETYGYGLGLYFCRRLAEAMSGRIWVESEPAQGATFCLALPLTESCDVQPHPGD